MGDDRLVERLGLQLAWLDDLADVDRLLLAFVVGVAAITAPRASGWLLAGLAGVALGLLLVASLAHRSARARVAHDFAPVAAVVCIFELAGAAIPIANPLRYDATLAAIDVRFFPGIVATWRDVLGRPAWLTDVVSIAYVSFYALPVAVGVALYRRSRPAFRAFAFDVVAVFLASYVGYFLVPATGPRVAIGLEDAIIGGGAASHAVRAFLHVAEKNTLDAFPSGHTAVTMVVAWSAGRRLVRGKGLVFAVATAIVFSTVYLYEHYVVDVVAGAVLAAAMIALLRRRDAHAFETLEASG